MTTYDQLSKSSRATMFFGIVTALSGFCLGDSCRPIMGVGVALWWMGALQAAVEDFVTSNHSSAIWQIMIGVLLFMMALYTMGSVLSDYGSSLTQRVTIMFLAVSVQSVIFTVYKNSGHMSDVRPN